MLRASGVSPRAFASLYGAMAAEIVVHRDDIIKDRLQFCSDSSLPPGTNEHKRTWGIPHEVPGGYPGGTYPGDTRGYPGGHPRGGGGAADRGQGAGAQATKYTAI